MNIVHGTTSRSCKPWRSYIVILDMLEIPTHKELDRQLVGSGPSIHYLNCLVIADDWKVGS
jgi:hypothetical protein